MHPLACARARSLLIFFSLCAVVAFLGCAESVELPPIEDDGPVNFEGNLDPNGGSFVLKELEDPRPNYLPLRLQLIGRNLEVDAANSTVSLEVAVRNLSEATLYPDLIVWLHDFFPEAVMPTNADLIPVLVSDDPLPNRRWGFVYSELLGEDGALSPRETSGFKRWSFHDPDLAPFSFAAELQFSVHPAVARLGGVVFNDIDADGDRDPGEMGFGGGSIFVDGPGREMTLVVQIRPDGSYEFPVKQAGLFTLRYVPPPTLAPFAALIFTTPNPLEVLMPPGPDGLPSDFLDADFGVHSLAFPIRPVEITDLSPGEIETDPYRTDHVWLRNTILGFDLGFSGCSGAHPFRLYMAGGFAESFPVQATLVLSHDDRGEACDAYFEERRFFELGPIVDLYKEMYNSGDSIRLNVMTPEGVYTFMLNF